jgi:hypothetical protein
MLPTHIENENYRFVIYNRNPLCILFASQAMINARVPTESLWHREAANKESMRALARWVGVRRASWQEWGRLAEAIGRDAFYRHMHDLMIAEPPALCTGTVVQRQDDPREIAMGEVTHGASGMRFEVLYRHRFASPAASDRFYDWFLTDRNCDLADSLLQIAYSKGTAALGKILDDLAAETAKPLNGAERRRRAKAAAKAA